MSLFLVDVEATSRSPFSGVMTEFGAVHFETLAWFHGVLYQSEPSSENAAIPVLAGVGGPTVAHGTAKTHASTVRPTTVDDRTEVFTRLNEWVKSFDRGRATFVSDNPGFDFGWMSYHSDEAGVDNVFGFSSRRIGDLAAGLSGDWRATSAWKRLRRTKHTHHPVDDAMGNAEALRSLLTQHKQRF